MKIIIYVTIIGFVSGNDLTGDPFCERGVVGSTNGKEICCLASCGTCGGVGCSSRDGGADGCCTLRIYELDETCTEFEAPTSADPFCETGIANDHICCSSSCGTCGGVDCSRREGGADDCCMSAIQLVEHSCEEYGPPCVLFAPSPDLVQVQTQVPVLVEVLVEVLVQAKVLVQVQVPVPTKKPTESYFPTAEPVPTLKPTDSMPPTFM